MQCNGCIISLVRDIVAVQGSAPFFKKCVEKVRTSKKCPVCTRGFDSQSDVDKVITTVRAEYLYNLLCNLYNLLCNLYNLLCN